MCTCQDFYGRKAAEHHTKTDKNNFFYQKNIKKERGIKNIRNIALFERWNSNESETEQAIVKMIYWENPAKAI